MKLDTPNYLAHVDGLRAIAVLAVIGYHIGLPGFSGGFVGVDVFFTISGFLIVGQIVDQLNRGTFSLPQFFARRILRLFPLLFIVILATCMVGALVVAMPAEYLELGRSAAYAALMISNQHFWATQDYFDAAAATKPLLHTWSLGVEAQFYLVAPLLIWACWRLSPVRRRPAVAFPAVAIGLVSLAACMRFTTAENNAAFFLMPFRAWEFLAGAAVLRLLPWAKTWPARVINSAGLAGLLLIVAGATFYTTALPYPSWRAVMPVLGAMLLILAGSATVNSLPHRVLSLRPLVALGLVSYGWYLWHWPILAFYRMSSFGQTSLAVETLLGGVLSLGLAAITYAAVERPVARIKGPFVRRYSGVTTFAGLFLAGLVALPGVWLWKVEYPRVQQALKPVDWPSKTTLNPDADVCIVRTDATLSSNCDLSPSKVRGILIGDSHSRESYKVLANAAAEADVKLVTMSASGCLPVFGKDVLYIGENQGCDKAWNKNRHTLETLPGRLDFAIVQASWSIYIGGANGHRAPRYLTQPGKPEAQPDQYVALKEGLGEVLDVLKQTGVKRLLIVAPSPAYDMGIPECVFRARRLGMDLDKCSRALEPIEAQRQRTLTALQALAAARRDVRVIDPFEAFCDKDLCHSHADDKPMYLDDNHLSQAGVARLFRHFSPELAWVFTGDKGTAN
jgi:peptidoglycan/LPS O-acetylase OafA/YrhL